MEKQTKVFIATMGQSSQLDWQNKFAYTRIFNFDSENTVTSIQFYIL